MKKILLSNALLVSLLVCWAGAYAQTYFCGINTANQDCPINNTPYNEELTIGFYPNAALTYRNNVSNTITGQFIYNYNASSVQTFDLPDKIHVNDMDQVDDKSVIVFCGNISIFDGMSSHTEGILGWFDPNNPTNYYIMQFPNVVTFERIVGYEWNSQMHLVSTGTHNSGGWVEDIIYVKDITLTAVTNKSYTHYLVSQGQVTSDIVKTQDYLAFVDAGSQLYLRRERYSDMFNATELGNYYVFPTVGVTPASRPMATSYQTCNNRMQLNIINMEISGHTSYVSIAKKQPLYINVVPYQINKASHGPVSTGCIH